MRRAGEQESGRHKASAEKRREQGKSGVKQRRERPRRIAEMLNMTKPVE